MSHHTMAVRMRGMKCCHICYLGMESRAVAPCYDCGHRESELLELATGDHVYREYRAFGHYSLILCDFCDVDFGSYHPSYFNLPGQTATVGEVLELVRTIDPTPYPIADSYCDSCGHRLAFLKFLSAVRERHSSR